MHVSLTPTLEDYARSKVQSGLYNNASEVIREALRLMVERDQKLKNLQSAVSLGFEALKSGNSTEITSKAGFLKIARGQK